jgi:hypothetical protein
MHDLFDYYRSGSEDSLDWCDSLFRSLLIVRSMKRRFKGIVVFLLRSFCIDECRELRLMVPATFENFDWVG